MTARGTGDGMYERWQKLSDDAPSTFEVLRISADKVRKMRELEEQLREDAINTWCERHPDVDRAVLEKLYDDIKRRIDDAWHEEMFGTIRRER